MDQAEGTQHQDIAPQGTPIAAQDAPAEKVLRQSEVNELVGRVKHDAYSKGLRDAQGMTQPNAQAAPQQGQGMGGIPQVTEDHVRQMIADEAHKQTQLAAAHGMLSNFVSQMGSGKGKYSDFDETVANLGDLKAIPHVVQMASETGNPGKVATLTTLAYVNPHLAKVEMKKLADSIKTNEQASKVPAAEDPLSQLKSSTVGTDNGSNAVRDLRNKSWARG